MEAGHSSELAHRIVGYEQAKLDLDRLGHQRLEPEVTSSGGEAV